MTWADADYKYRKKITIDKDEVVGTNNNFPVLISIASDDDLKDNVENANGYDIVFYASNNSTLLYHEIEYYNSGTGKYIAWVSVPTVSSAADTDIYMYYSKTGVVANPSSTSTWDSNYKMVQHMSDLTTSTTKDSTSNGYNGTKKGANEPIVTANGKIHYAQDFDGSNDGILIGDGTVGALTTCAASHTCTSPWTISAWIKKEAASQTSVILGRTDDYWWDKYGVGLICKTTYVCGQSEWNNDNATVNAAANDTNWHYVVAIVNASTGRIYLDGTQIATGTLNSGNCYRLWIGKQDHDGGTAYAFNGIIDEVRTSNIERSADWINTEFNNQDDPSAFYSIDIQEPYSTAHSINLGDTVKVGDSLLKVKNIFKNLSDTVKVRDTKTLTLRPNGAGTSTNLTKNGAATNWECVNETPSDEDTTYVSPHVDAGSVWDTYNIANHTTEYGRIFSITFYTRCRKDVTTAYQYEAGTAFRIGGTNYFSYNWITQTYADYPDVRTTNPKTGLPWTWTDVDNLEIGVIMRMGGSANKEHVRCTQVWAEIKYENIRVEKDINVDLNDTIIVSDSLSKIKTINRTLADTVKIAESINVALHKALIAINLFDTVLISDSLTKVKAINITLDDTTVISDSLSKIKAINLMLNDTVLVAELLTKEKVISRTLADTIIISELFNKTKIININLADTILVADLLSKVKTINRNLADTVVVSDLLGKIKIINKTLADTVIISDSIIKSLGINIMLSDTIILSDSLNKLKEINIILSDTVIVSDILSKLKVISKTLNDTVIVADSLIKLRTILRTLFDTVIVSDSLSKVKTINKILADTVIVSDSIIKVKGINIILSDTVKVADSLSKWKGINISLADTVKVADSFTRAMTYERSFFDTIKVSDSLFKSKAINVVLADAVKTSDTIQILGISHFTITWDGGVIEFHNLPYWKGLSGNLDFNYTNLSFKSGNYASYINDINDERLIIAGWEDIGAMTKFTTLHNIADNGYRISVHNIGQEYDGIYIIEGIMYKPISPDVFDYQLILRFVRRF